MQNVKYFKRHRMELALAQLPGVPELPAGFRWVPWDDSLLAMHAEVKFQSFRQHEVPEERLQRVLASALLSPACGLAMRTVSDAERVFADLDEARARVREALG